MIVCFLDFTVDNNKIEKEYINEVTNISWLDVEQVKETQNFYLFYINNKLFLFISKSFISKDEESILRDLVNKNLDPKIISLKVRKPEQ